MEQSACHSLMKNQQLEKEKFWESTFKEFKIMKDILYWHVQKTTAIIKFNLPKRPRNINFTTKF